MNKPLFPEIRVNGHVIPAEDIAAEAQMHDAPGGKPGLAWRKAARALVIRRLLLEEARRLSLDPAPQELSAGRVETEEEAQIRALLDASLSPAPASEGEARAIWRAAPEKFGDRPFHEVRERIVEALERRNWAAAARDFARRLTDLARVEGIDLTQPIG